MVQVNLDVNTLELDNRIEKLTEKEAFLTSKDHKPNLFNNPKCLINSTKSKIGIVSMKLLDRINFSIRSSSGLVQWRNSSAVFSWFQKIPRKDKCKKFRKFDILDFYLVITEDLLTKSLEFAQNCVEVDEHTANIIMHCRQSILFSNGSAWSK